MSGKIVITFSVLLLLPAWSWANSKLLRLYLPIIMEDTQQTSPITGIYQLPDTGQKRCYDFGPLAGQINCPSEGRQLYGQDANYEGPQLAYEVNGDGTITDLNTNLIWQQYTPPPHTWEGAVSYCSTSTFTDANDWRLPSKMELQSIVDYSQFNPASNSSFLSQSAGYWSATPVANSTNRAWAIYFEQGNDEQETMGSSNHVRCVRN